MSEQGTRTTRPGRWLSGPALEAIAVGFEILGYRGPADIPGGVDPDGAYAVNVARRYQADLTEAEVYRIIDAVLSGDHKRVLALKDELGVC